MAPAVETTDDTPLQCEEKTATSVEMIQVDSAGFAVKMWFSCLTLNVLIVYNASLRAGLWNTYSMFKH